MDLIFLILFCVYNYAGDQANQYLKYHFLNVRAEVYSNTGNYIVQRIILGGILGWITIPIAILHYVIKNKDNNAE